MTRGEAIKSLEHYRYCLDFQFGWFGKGDNETINMAIEALQAEPTNGRLIDADALMEYCSNQKTKTISNNDIARFPTVQAARPTGEWIDKGDYAECSSCGAHSGTQFDGVEPMPRKTKFCSECGAYMRNEVM